MYTNYHRILIHRPVSGIYEITMQVVEGDMVTAKHIGLHGDLDKVESTKYIPAKLLKTITIKVTGSPSDAELKESCKVELGKDLTRTPIDIQKVKVA